MSRCSSTVALLPSQLTTLPSTYVCVRVCVWMTYAKAISSTSPFSISPPWAACSCSEWVGQWNRVPAAGRHVTHQLVVLWMVVGHWGDLMYSLQHQQISSIMDGRQSVHNMCACSVGVASFFQYFLEINLPLYVGHKFVFRYTNTVHQTHALGTIKFRWVKPPRGGSAFMSVCLIFVITFFRSPSGQIVWSSKMTSLRGNWWPRAASPDLAAWRLIMLMPL